MRRIIASAVGAEITQNERPDVALPTAERSPRSNSDYFCGGGMMIADAAMSQRPLWRTITFMYCPWVGVPGGGDPPSIA